MGFKWIREDLKGDFCNMVLLQRGTTRIAGRVDVLKNENTPLCRKTAKSRALHYVYYAVYTVHIVYLAFFRGRRGRGLLWAFALLACIFYIYYLAIHSCYTAHIFYSYILQL